MKVGVFKADGDSRHTTHDNAGGRTRTCEPTKGTALEAVAFDHFATPAIEEEIR